MALVEFKAVSPIHNDRTGAIIPAGTIFEAEDGEWVQSLIAIGAAEAVPASQADEAKPEPKNRPGKPQAIAAEGAEPPQP